MSLCVLRNFLVFFPPYLNCAAQSVMGNLLHTSELFSMMSQSHLFNTWKVIIRDSHFTLKSVIYDLFLKKLLSTTRFEKCTNVGGKVRFKFWSGASGWIGPEGERRGRQQARRARQLFPARLYLPSALAFSAQAWTDLESVFFQIWSLLVCWYSS